LITLIKNIGDFVKATPGQRLEIRYQYGAGLELRKQREGVTSVLPHELVARWAGWSERGESIHEELVAKSKPLDGGVTLDHKSEDGSTSDEGFDDDEFDWDGAFGDFTACSADSCGYCGHCSY
jgi:hypothetical protein